VSSSTPSFNGTLPLTKSLNVKSALLVTTLGFINNGSKGAHAWTETQASEGRHRSTIGAGPGWSTADLRINLAHRLWAEHGEFADDSQLQCPGCQEKVWEALHLRTMAIQHWQALKCQQLISREERALKQEYNAVVHLRPDVVVFWGHPDITSDHAERLGAVRTCSFVASHRLQRTSAGASRPWLLRPAMNSQYFCVGSRKLMFDTRFCTIPPSDELTVSGKADLDGLRATGPDGDEQECEPPRVDVLRMLGATTPTISLPEFEDQESGRVPESERGAFHKSIFACTFRDEPFGLCFGKDTLLVHDAYLPLRKLEHCFGARYDSTKVTRNVKFGDMQDGQAPDTASKRLAPWKIGAVVSSDATDDGWSD